MPSFRFALILAFALIAPFALAQQRATTASQVASVAAQAYGNLPMRFEPNVGQTDSQVKFLSHDGGYTLFLTSTEAVLALRSIDLDASVRGRFGRRILGKPTLPVFHTTVIRMRLSGASATSSVSASQQLPGTVNYLIGNDPAKWQTAVPTYSVLSYQEVYPGIDLVYYGKQHQLEYDFVVKPGADPKAIAMEFEGPESLSATETGDIALDSDGKLLLRRPTIYQMSSGCGRMLKEGSCSRDQTELLSR